MVKRKRAKDHIFQIQNEDHIITNPEAIGSSAVSYFQNLFSGDSAEFSMDDLEMIPSIITQEESDTLRLCPDAMEIKEVVFAMDPDSVAGPDGFNAKFFQQCWEIIVSDVVEAVRAFFQGMPIPRGFSATSIVLIPKVDSPSSWKDFRPISLCNTTSKILSKLLVVKLNGILPRVISPSQSGFLPGRLISDNILLAQEMVHDFGRSKRNVILKLDMHKAYDRVSWSFLIAVLRKFGFPEAWIHLIRNLISNCWFSVMVNGSPFGFFRSERGLRQGDPISPALFVLAAEAFSRGLNRLFQQHPELYYKVRRDVRLSHLAYADDMIIFTQCTRGNLQILKHFFHKYEETSGQLISISKSTFITYQSSGFFPRLVKEVTGFSQESLPFTYLGAPLHKGNQKAEMYDFLLSKMRKKLLTWQHSSLSNGGRLQLIRSSLFSITLYILQIMQPPKNVITNLERLFNRFFWGSTAERKKIHWTSWNQVCYPFEEGGLNVRSLYDTIKAFSFKLWWRFRSRSSLWADFLMEKYCRTHHPIIVKISPHDSYIWKRMAAIRKEAEQGIFWSIGTGDVSF